MCPLNAAIRVSLIGLLMLARRSRKFFVPAFLVILATSCSRRQQQQHRLPKSFYDTAATAIDAVIRENDYRDNTTILYEPRRLDVEKSISDLRRVTDHGNSVEESIDSQIESCSKKLTSYREATIQGNGEPTQSLADAVDDCMEVVRRVLSAADSN
jgi:hypothetical protein